MTNFEVFIDRPVVHSSRPVPVVSVVSLITSSSIVTVIIGSICSSNSCRIQVNEPLTLHYFGALCSISHVAFTGLKKEEVESVFNVFKFVDFWSQMRSS